jgi:tetratricopeptide (TPR) repeat protein
MYAEAYDAFKMAKKLAPEQTWSDAIGLVPLLVETGRREEAQQILDEMLLLSKTRSVSPGNIAMAYKALGRKNEALDWLEKAYQLRDPRIAMIKTFRYGKTCIATLVSGSASSRRVLKKAPDILQKASIRCSF